MTFKLSQRSLNNLKGVDEDLVAVVKRAIEITEVDFGVTEGIRTLDRQEELYKKGLSKTMKSKHLIGRAVDVVAYVDGKVSWEEQYYHTIATAMKSAATELNVNIKWGGDFKSFFDGPHFELI
jgi:peptidoglycan L-alanyl-D-glutamate endopeptidase CwlK